jgi:hypothetical protein
VPFFNLGKYELDNTKTDEKLGDPDKQTRSGGRKHSEYVRKLDVQETG